MDSERRDRSTRENGIPCLGLHRSVDRAVTDTLRRAKYRAETRTGNHLLAYIAFHVRVWWRHILVPETAERAREGLSGGPLGPAGRAALAVPAHDAHGIGDERTDLFCRYIWGTGKANNID